MSPGVWTNKTLIDWQPTTLPRGSVRFACVMCVCVRACVTVACEHCCDAGPLFYGLYTCDKSTEELKCFSTTLKAMCQHWTTKSTQFPWTVSLPLIVYHSSVSGGWPLWRTGASPWGDHVSVEIQDKYWCLSFQTSVPPVAALWHLCKYLRRECCLYSLCSLCSFCFKSSLFSVFYVPLHPVSRFICNKKQG